MAGMAGLEPTQCQNQNLVPYQLGDIPTSSARPIIKRFELFVKQKNKKNKKIFKVHYIDAYIQHLCFIVTLVKSTIIHLQTQTK